MTHPKTAAVAIGIDLGKSGGDGSSVSIRSKGKIFIFTGEEASVIYSLVLQEQREARIEGIKAMQQNAAKLCENEAYSHLADAESLNPTRARRGRAMMGGPLRCAKAIRALSADSVTNQEK